MKSDNCHNVDADAYEHMDNMDNMDNMDDFETLFFSNISW